MHGNGDCFTGYASIDKPWLKTVSIGSYNKDVCKKTAYDLAFERAQGYENYNVYNFYGRKIKTHQFFKEIDEICRAYTGIGVKKNDIVFMIGLNTPEMYKSLYALNRLGVITEWFNPQGMTDNLLREHLIENNVRYIFSIDIMYENVKRAIDGTNVEKVIINSILDSLPPFMSVGYYLTTFGLDWLSNLSAIQEYALSTNNQELMNRISFSTKLVTSIKEKAIQDKVALKTAFYKRKDVDERFIDWNIFIGYGKNIKNIIVPEYEFDKTTMIIHTGGTTGPIKRVKVNDYAINSAPYQISLMPNTFQPGDSLCQLVPPIVAWSLESIHCARYFNMMSNLIATYDRKEFIDIVLKYKSNHYFTVPSFVKMLKEEENRLEGKSLKFIKTIFHGGEGISEQDDREIDRILLEHGSKIKNANGFGQNEEFGGFIVNIQNPSDEKIYGNCGVPLAGNEFIIYDLEHGTELPYGPDENGNYRVGELLLSGPSIMQGYTGKDAYLNDKVFIKYKNKVYVDTGDQAYCDENGRMHYVTREQRIIRTQAGKVFVNVLESLISEIPEVNECCVVKMPDEKNVAKPCCIIVLNKNITEDRVDQIIKNVVEIVEEATKKMYTFYEPGSYIFRRKKLPITSFGKIAFRELEKEVEEEYFNNGNQMKKIIKRLDL